VNHRLARSLAVLTGITLALLHLGRQNLWTDEAMSLEAVQTWGGLMRFFRALPEQHPLYYLLLRPWLALGQSEVALRSLSVVFFVLTIPLIARLTSHVLGQREGTLAAWLAATSPFLIYYGQEARMYSLVALLATASTVALVQWSQTGARASLAGYALLAILGCYTHFFFTFLIVAHFLGLLLVRGWRGPGVRILLFVQAIVAAAYLPWVVLLVTHLGHGQDWKDAATVIFAIPYTLLRFTVGYGVVPANYGWRQHLPELIAADAPALVLAGLGFAVATIAGANRLWRLGGLGRAMLVTGLAPVLIAMAASAFVIIVSERYFVLVFPFFVIVVAAGILALLDRPGLSRRIGWASAALLIGATAIGLGKYYWSPGYGKEQWQEAATLVRQNRLPGDLIVVHKYFAAGVFRYYYRPDSGEVIVPNDDPQILPPVKTIWAVISHSNNEAEYLARFGPAWRTTMDRRYTNETGIRVVKLEHSAAHPAP